MSWTIEGRAAELKRSIDTGFTYTEGALVVLAREVAEEAARIVEQLPVMKSLPTVVSPAGAIRRRFGLEEKP